ncbi:MAG: hypothetical protein KA248_15460 [Kiritimatiellae bacterium]|nr:hypothetical protein [Kiritimatiellia bacterium]
MADISDIYSFMRKAAPPPFSAAGLAGAHQASARKHRSSAQVVVWMGLAILLVLAIVAFFEGRSGSPDRAADARTEETGGAPRPTPGEPAPPGVLPFMVP